MRVLRACARFCAAMAHVLVGLATILLKFPKLDAQERHRRVQQWSQQMLARLGVQLRVLGTPAATGPMMLVCNHISWMDITALHAARYCRFVSKADIKHWPVVGRLAIGTDTLFIEREKRRDAMRVVHHMTEALRDGDVLGIFPEGTTSNGVGMLPFHANLFQAAIAANAPVQPVALRFVDLASGQQSLAPCYIGNDTLFGSLWRALKADPLCVVVRFGEPQHFAGRDRRVWAADLQTEVERLRQLPL